MVNYDLYKVKLFLLQLVVKTSTLWHYMFRSVCVFQSKVDQVPLLLLYSLSEPAGYTCTTSSSPGMCVEENHVTLTRQLVSQPKFEPDASQIQVKYITTQFL